MEASRSFFKIFSASSETRLKPILPKMLSMASVVIAELVREAIWSRRDSASRKLPSADEAMRSIASSDILIFSAEAIFLSLFIISFNGARFIWKCWAREATVGGIFSSSVVARMIVT